MRPRIRVVYLLTKLELGGAQQIVLDLAAHLNRDLFEVTLITGAEGLLVEQARQVPGLRLILVPSLRREILPPADLTAVARLAHLLRGLRRAPGGPLLVHTHSSKAGVLGRWAAHLAGVRRIVHTVHGFPFHPGQPLALRRMYVTLEWLAGRVTTHHVLVSRVTLEQGVALGLVDPGRASVIPGGIDLQAFHPDPADRAAVRAELGVEPSAPLAGMIACLKPQKDPVAFVEVARRIAGCLPCARFVLAGDGVLRPGVEAAVGRAGLGSRFRLLGWRRDVPRLLRALDLFVLTSRWEGLPLTYLEAMATGVPIVGTAVDGAPEAVLNGEQGRLYPLGEVDAMAAGAVEILQSPALAREMAARGMARAREFDRWKMLGEHEALYLRLAGVA